MKNYSKYALMYSGGSGKYCLTKFNQEVRSIPMSTG